MNRRWINQDDIKAAIRANDGSASVPEIAAHIAATFGIWLVGGLLFNGARS